MVAVVFASQLAIDPELGLLVAASIAASPVFLIVVLAVPVDVVHVSTITRGRRQVTVNCFELLFELFSSHFRSCFSCEALCFFVRHCGVIPLLHVGVLDGLAFDPEVPVRALHQVRATGVVEPDQLAVEDVVVFVVEFVFEDLAVYVGEGNQSGVLERRDIIVILAGERDEVTIKGH